MIYYYCFTHWRSLVVLYATIAGVTGAVTYYDNGSLMRLWLCATMLTNASLACCWAVLGTRFDRDGRLPHHITVWTVIARCHDPHGAAASGAHVDFEDVTCSYTYHDEVAALRAVQRLGADEKYSRVTLRTSMYFEYEDADDGADGDGGCRAPATRSTRSTY